MKESKSNLFALLQFGSLPLLVLGIGFYTYFKSGDFLLTDFVVIRSVLERLGLMSGQESGWTMIQWMSRQGRTFMRIVISSQTMAERDCCMTEAQNE